MVRRKSNPKHPHKQHASEHIQRGRLLSGPLKVQPVVAVLMAAVLAGLGIFVVYKSLAATGSLSLVPTSSTVSLGSSFTVVVHENSGTDAVNAVEADMTYDATKFQFVSIDATASAFDLSATSTGGAGSVKIARAKSNTSLTGDQVVASVTFTAIGSGATTIPFAATSALVRASDTTNVLVTTTPGSYTIADTTAPTVPTGLAAPTKTVTTVALSWTASTDNVAVSGYDVYRNGVKVGTVTAPATTYTDTGLTPNTSYTYTVDAFDAATPANVSAKTAGLVAATLPDTTAPTVPTALTAPTKTVTTIALSWTASTDNVAVSGYKVFRGGVQVGTVTAPATTFTDTGLTPNTSYSYTVSANDAAGNNSAQTVASSFATLPDTTAPSVPTGLISSTQTVNTIALAWTASTDNVAVTGYKIFRAGVQVGTSATTTFTDTALTQGTAYSYTVSANDAAGNNSAQSTASSFSTKTKPGDINSDGTVGILDLSILAAHFGQTGTFSQGDLNGDGVVNVFDLSILATYWGT
ncbi:MAG TPA: fibronectin type III domain-containing protein [Candidatus Saccharimonadales bacterium]|nr:fibronectin type III domain-containing protein [Candidatus Saccharimonadales bacterium]